MRVTFWGVRGSIPTPGPETVGIGGNTSCVEVVAGDPGHEQTLIFDGGTGLRLLGKTLVGTRPLVAHIFFSHVHWDHIQGFPFFDPAFIPGNTIHLYGGSNVSRTLEETLAGQMDHPSFPVHLSDMGAKMTFNDLEEGATLQLPGGVRITTARGNHPNGVFAYRVDHAGKAVVYATDTEHGVDVDPALRALSQDADVLINDAQYTPEEYEGTAGTGGSKKGWGHSTFVASAELAKAAGARKLYLFHHDPLQDDAAVREKERRARLVFSDSFAAYEGLVLDV